MASFWAPEDPQFPRVKHSSLVYWTLVLRSPKISRQERPSMKSRQTSNQSLSDSLRSKRSLSDCVSNGVLYRGCIADASSHTSMDPA